MIVVEERFREIFETVPTYPLEGEPEGLSLPLVYWWGEQKELNRVLIEKQVNEENAYPLLWYIMPSQEREYRNGRIAGDFSFVLAMNTEYEWFNDQRWNSTFAKYLFPYYELIKQSLTKSGIINLFALDGNKQFFEFTKLPNYGNPTTFEGKDETKQGDFWDAILFKFRGEINDNCLQHIKYNIKNIVK